MHTSSRVDVLPNQIETECFQDEGKWLKTKAGSGSLKPIQAALHRPIDQSNNLLHLEIVLLSRVFSRPVTIDLFKLEMLETLSITTMLQRPNCLKHA